MSTLIQEAQIVQKANNKYTPYTFRLNFPQRGFKERAHVIKAQETRRRQK